MRIFKNKWFVRFANKQKISDEKLREAVEGIENGLVDADLGGGVIKQRISRPNEGKSGGYRTIILYCQGDKAFFVYGFAKNSKANITEKDLTSFKEAATTVLNFSDQELETFIGEGIFTEVKCDD